MFLLTIIAILMLFFLCRKTYQKYPQNYLINPGFWFALSWAITLVAYIIPLMDYNIFYQEEYSRLIIYVIITSATWLFLLYIPIKKKRKFNSVISFSKNNSSPSFKIMRFLAIIFGVISLFGSIVVFKKIIFSGSLLERRLFYLERPSEEYLYFEWLYLAGQVSAFLFGYLIEKHDSIFKKLVAVTPFAASIIFAFGTGRRQHMLFIIAVYLFGIFLSQGPSIFRRLKEKLQYNKKIRRRFILFVCITLIIFSYIFNYIHEESTPSKMIENQLTDLGRSWVGKAIFMVIPLGIWDYTIKPIYAYQSRISIFRTFDIQYGRYSFWPIEYIAVKFLGYERKLLGREIAPFFDKFPNSPATIFCGFTYDYSEPFVIPITILIILISSYIFRLFISKKNFSIFMSIIMLHICLFWGYSTQFSYFISGGQLLIFWAAIAHFSYHILKKSV